MRYFSLVLVLSVSVFAGDIVCVGDSVTAQYVTPPPATHNYVAAMEVLLRCGQAPTARVISAGVGGNTSTMVVNRYDADVLAKKPAAIVVLIGINDVHQFKPIAEYEANLRWIAKRTKDALPDTKLYFVAPFLIARSGAELVSTAVSQAHWDLLPQFTETMRKVAGENGIPFLDMHAEFQDALKSNTADYFCTESVHPAENGKVFMAQRIIARLLYPSVIPAPSIKGDKGEKGDVGPKGDKGDSSALEWPKGMILTMREDGTPPPGFVLYKNGRLPRVGRVGYFVKD